MFIKNHIVKNIVLLAVSIFTSLLIIEILLPFLKIKGIERFVFLRRMPIVQYIYGEYKPIVEYTLRPNIKNAHLQYKDYTNYTFSTNKYGFRGADWDLAKNRRNVLVLGDSFAFGWGVNNDQTFSYILNKELEKKNPDFQVINLAQSGYFLDQVVNNFRLHRDLLHPEIVIYLYCYNDPLLHPKEINHKFDIKNYRAKITAADFNEEARRNNVNIWRFERFYKSLYLYAFYRNYVVPLFVGQHTSSARNAWKQRYEFTYKNLSPPTPPSKPVPLNNEKKKYIWYGLKQIRKIAGNNCRIILMDTSDKMLIHMPDSKKSDRWILRDFARQYANVTFVDFESTIRRKNDGVARFLKIDDHWNVKGHKLAAKMLLNAISN
ncbi:SGNH/GDSL hydrolase family protein [Desulfobacterota bacterium M19]